MGVKKLSSYEEDFNIGSSVGFTYAEEVYRRFTFEIDSEIVEPSYYSALINTLENATETDTVILRINSVGGRVDSAIDLVTALQNTLARTIAHTTGHCYSAATLLALSCGEVYVGSYSDWMLHNAAGGFGGTIVDIKQQANHEHDMLEKLFKDVYIPFLSEEEVDLLLRNGAIWLTAEEVKERLANMYEILQQEAEEFIAEMEADKEEATKPKRKKQLLS